MSGVEIVVIIGLGIWVTKKIQKSRAEKKQRQLGLLTEQHGQAEVVTTETESRRQRHRNAEDDEALPLYPGPAAATAAANDEKATEVEPPSYDESAGASSSNHDGTTDLNAQQAISPTTEARHKKWQIWKKPPAKALQV